MPARNDEACPLSPLACLPACASLTFDAIPSLHLWTCSALWFSVDSIDCNCSSAATIAASSAALTSGATAAAVAAGMLALALGSSVNGTGAAARLVPASVPPLLLPFAESICIACAVEGTAVAAAAAAGVLVMGLTSLIALDPVGTVVEGAGAIGAAGALDAAAGTVVAAAAAAALLMLAAVECAAQVKCAARVKMRGDEKKRAECAREDGGANDAAANETRAD